MVVAAGIVLIPGAPLGLITTSVQAPAGLLLPSASVFLLLLCNDPEILLGPWVNPRWLNLVAAEIVGVLLILSGTLLSTTLFPTINVTHVFAAAKMPTVQKMSWRMTPLALLKPVRWSPGLRVGILALRAYLVVSAILLLVKAVQLGQGH